MNLRLDIYRYEVIRHDYSYRTWPKQKHIYTSFSLLRFFFFFFYFRGKRPRLLPLPLMSPRPLLGVDPRGM